MLLKKQKPKISAKPNPQTETTVLEGITHPHSAGNELAAEEIVVAVPRDRGMRFVRTFCIFTRDLHELRDWLLRCRIQTVAIESTGNYWVPLYQIVEEEPRAKVQPVQLDGSAPKTVPTAWPRGGVESRFDKLKALSPSKGSEGTPLFRRSEEQGGTSRP